MHLIQKSSFNPLEKYFKSRSQVLNWSLVIKHDMIYNPTSPLRHCSISGFYDLLKMFALEN